MLGFDSWSGGPAPGGGGDSLGPPGGPPLGPPEPKGSV